jgi:hypothetical protein
MSASGPPKAASMLRRPDMLRRATIALACVLPLIGIASAQQPSTTGPVSTHVAAAGIAFDLPANWTPEAPSSSMRLAQGTFPGTGGAAQWGVFFFGARGGGSAEDNLKRWSDQIVNPGAVPKKGVLSAHGLSVSWIEAAGTLKASTIGMGPSTDQPNSRLLGAVVEGAGGPWFFKVTGPDATVAAERESFFNLLRGVHPG